LINDIWQGLKALSIVFIFIFAHTERQIK
jgi:hypothetical protein